MKTIFKLTVILVFALMLSAQANAQGNNPPAKKPASQKSSSQQQATTLKFLQNRDAKRWVVGGQIGTSLFHGDADKLKPGFSIGGNLRYNFSHVLGIRLLANYAKVRSEFEHPATLTPSMTYYKLNSTVFEYQLQGVLTLGNISFFRKKWNWNLYTAMGVGQVKMHSVSDFDFVSAPGNPSQMVYDHWHIAFTYGLGVKRNINKTIDLGIEYGMRWTRTDSMDILNAPIHPNRKFDSYSFPQVVINIKLGKKGNEHLDWINPISSVYEELNKFEDKLDKLDKDSDNDGVPDRFDKEENTPAGAKVWGSGEAVDLDNDGVPDVNDQEPNTPAGAKVDANTGIAEDEDSDGVPDILDLSPETPAEYLVNHQGIPIMQKDMADQIINNEGDKMVNTTIGGGGGGISFLPAIFFATNVDEPYPVHLVDLQNVAQAMKNNPGIKLEVIGNADMRNSDEYNLRLAQRRADHVKKILVEFGVDGSRLITKTNGERQPITKGTSEMHLQANRRVQFFIVK